MSPGFSVQDSPPAAISGSSLRKPSESLTADYLYLDLRAGAGNLLGPSWERNFPLPGASCRPNTSTFPSGGGGSSLSRILEDTAPLKYCLSHTSCRGILRRAKKRDKALPELLSDRLKLQIEMMKQLETLSLPEDAELIILDDSSDANMAGSCLTPWDAQRARVFISTGMSPTLSGCDNGGGRNPGGFVLVLNDQGGDRMDVSEDQCGTLRAQMGGHVPLLFSNHAQDSRYTGPLEVAPTVQASYGSGGGNTPLITTAPQVYCIAGNAIDRQPQNGGNGLGCQEGLSYTLTATDRPAVFSQQRSDEYRENTVTSTQSARQYKDSTDLILTRGFIRRLLPIECERLMDFPDNWTNVPAGSRPASDSARYRACGNSMVVRCVEYILRAALYFLLEEGERHA